MAKINIDTQVLGNMKLNNSVPSPTWNTGRFKPISMFSIAKELDNLSMNSLWADIRLKNASTTLKKYANELKVISTRIKNFNDYMAYFSWYESLEKEIAERAAIDIDVSVSLSEGDTNRINLLYEKILLGTATAAEIQEYIKLYDQTLTEEERKNMEKFLDIFSDEDAAKIKEMLYTAKEPFKTELINMIKSGEIKFETINGKDVSNYDSFNNVLQINPKNLSEKDSRGKFYAIWHELGHAHDDFNNDENGYSWTDVYTTEDGKSINDLIKEDARRTIYDRCDELYPNLTEQQKKEIADYMISGGKTDISWDDRAKVWFVQQQISWEQMRARDHTASDCYSCITNHGIKPGNYCHDKKYEDEKAMAEAYADYIAMNMTNNTKAEDSYKYYMPSVYKEIDRRVRGL